MKYVILISSFLLFFKGFAICQLEIKPFVGYDNSYINNIKGKQGWGNGFGDWYQFKLAKPGFGYQSFVFGLEFNASLNSQYSLLLITSYTSKKVNDVFIWGFIPYSGYGFRYYRNQLGVRHSLSTYLQLKAGANINLMDDFRYILNDELKDNLPIAIHKEFGVFVILSGRIKNFELDLYYIQNLNSLEDKRSELNLRGLSSIGLTLGYQLKL